ncbi:MAG: hypothetical protein WC796_04340 [Candidatus Pacearchaeota archaeon]|jgi:hypothetical protein
MNDKYETRQENGEVDSGTSNPYCPVSNGNPAFLALMGSRTHLDQLVEELNLRNK